MTDKWKTARRLMAAYLRKCARFHIIVKFDSGVWARYSNYPVELTVPPSVASMLDGYRTQYADVDIVTVGSPEEFNRICSNNVISSWRIDAVTNGSFPVDDIPQLVDTWVPSAGGRDVFHGYVTCPYKVFNKINDGWEFALRRLGITDREYIPLRYIPQDAIPYANGNSNGDFITHTMCQAMPHGMLDSRGYDVLCAESKSAFPCEPLWMSRAVFELIPVPMHQRIVYGEHKLTNINVGDLYEVYSMAVYDRNIQSAFNLMDYCVKYIRSAIRINKNVALAYAPDEERPAIRCERERWKSSQSLQIPERATGMGSLGRKLICLNHRDMVVSFDEQLESLKLDYSSSDVYSKLAAQHTGDALETTIGDAWEEQ